MSVVLILQWKIWSLIFLAYMSCSHSTTTVGEKPGCVISINEDLQDPQPLILHSHTKSTSAIESFPEPFDDEGTIHFRIGEKVEFVCTGGNLTENGGDTFKSIVQATCVNGTQFVLDNNKHVHVNNLNCSTFAEHKARYTGKICADGFNEVEIGVQVKTRFIRHIMACYDNYTQMTAYTVYNLTSEIAGSQVGYARPAFEESEFYRTGSKNVNWLYTRKLQRETINKILDLPPQSNSVIRPGNKYYLARGHLTAKSDFVFGNQQRLTFYFINAAPQWQIFNNGNWKKLESSCRYFASRDDLDLVVYTGTFGVTKLRAKNGQKRKLYLYDNGMEKGIPVPELFWKVLYEPKSKAGIAFVGVNNPYAKNVKQYVHCKDICRKVKWLRWNPHNVTQGYSYCCAVDDLRKVIKSIPMFRVNKLLL